MNVNIYHSGAKQRQVRNNVVQLSMKAMRTVYETSGLSNPHALGASSSPRTDPTPANLSDECHKLLLRIPLLAQQYHRQQVAAQKDSPSQKSEQPKRADKKLGALEASGCFVEQDGDLVWQEAPPVQASIPQSASQAPSHMTTDLVQSIPHFADLLRFAQRQAQSLHSAQLSAVVQNQESTDAMAMKTKVSGVPGFTNFKALEEQSDNQAVSHEALPIPSSSGQDEASRSIVPLGAVCPESFQQQSTSGKDENSDPMVVKPAIPDQANIINRIIMEMMNERREVAESEQAGSNKRQKTS